MTDAAPGDAMTAEAWLSLLGAQLPASPALTPGETAALLDLARAAAHRSERIAAPLTTFLAGIAFHDLAAQEREAQIRALTARLARE